MFYPKSVAVVGASAGPARRWPVGSPGGAGYVERLREAGFPGTIYPVNPKATVVQGLKAYPDVSSIPEQIDLVIIAVPAQIVPAVLEDCIAAGVKNIHIFSSGFSEIGTEEGRKLEERIKEIIRRGGLQVVGPNCMGIYVPASKLVGWGQKPDGVGAVAFISQSGGHGDRLIRHGQGLGIQFSKVISFGNAAGLQVMDFLEYLANDPETKFITMYLEGLKDGNRTAQLIRTINRTKPVIIWKGGLTPSGSKAVASHTGSLAGKERVWDAFFAQTGAVRADSLEEIIDVVMAFLYLKPPKSRRTLLLGGGGGNSVALADICGREGLEVPTLSEESRRELNSFITLAGNSIRNPLDIWPVLENVELLQRAVDISVADPSIDLVIADRYLGGESDDSPERADRQSQANNFLTDFARRNAHNKPMYMAINTLDHDPELIAAAAKLRREYALAGIPAYMSQASAARALSRFIRYHEFQRHAS
jgi:acyl-CoA synthetase (NDP forming)